MPHPYCTPQIILFEEKAFPNPMKVLCRDGYPLTTVDERFAKLAYDARLIEDSQL